MAQGEARADRHAPSSLAMMDTWKWARRVRGSATNEQSGGDAAAAVGHEIDESKFTN